MNEPTQPTISLLAAVADNGVIGRAGDLPWHLPADLKHFKRLTTDHTIIMGRRTYESIGQPLPRRRSIVVTRQTDYPAEGIEVASSFKAALALVHGEGEVFVIGGRSIYEAALPYADRLYMTWVHGQIEGDVHFPPFDVEQWRVLEQSDHPSDEKHAYAMTFQTLEHITASSVQE
jgi:dihydrofolate reductase